MHPDHVRLDADREHCDPGGAEPLSHYSATINWGDAKTSAGTISFAAGVFTVKGSHVYTGTGEKGSYAGDNSVYPDGFTLRVGVTTVVDAGSAGANTFPGFRRSVVEASRGRVLAYLNISATGQIDPFLVLLRQRDAGSGKHVLIDAQVDRLGIGEDAVEIEHDRGDRQVCFAAGCVGEHHQGGRTARGARRTLLQGA